MREDLEKLGFDPSTIDELEDHYLTAIEAGIDPATARARLGDLAALAREHRRVRGAFGPQPSRVIAWAVAAAMIALPLIITRGDGGLGNQLFAFLTGVGAIRTLAILALLFRWPQAAGYVLGVAAAELVALLVSGYLVPDPYAFSLVAIAAGCCALLATRGFTRWRLAMALVGYTTASVNFYDPALFGALNLPVAPLLLLVAIMIALRLRVAFAWSVVISFVIIAEQARAIVVLLRLGPTLLIVHAVVVALAAIGFTILAARGDRRLRPVLDEWRASRTPDAPA